MKSTIQFRDEWLKNHRNLVNDTSRETLLMKAYALYYHESKVKNLNEETETKPQHDRCITAKQVIFKKGW